MFTIYMTTPCKSDFYSTLYVKTSYLRYEFLHLVMY